MEVFTIGDRVSIHPEEAPNSPRPKLLGRIHELGAHIVVELDKPLRGGITLIRMMPQELRHEIEDIDP